MSGPGTEHLAPQPKESEPTEPYEEPFEEVSHQSSDTSATEADEKTKTEQQQEDGGPIAKKTSKASVNNYNAIPNGGLRAWLQVAGGFMLFFNNCTIP